MILTLWSDYLSNTTNWLVFVTVFTVRSEFLYVALITFRLYGRVLYFIINKARTRSGKPCGISVFVYV